MRENPGIGLEWLEYSATYGMMKGGDTGAFCARDETMGDLGCMVLLNMT